MTDELSAARKALLRKLIEVPEGDLLEWRYANRRARELVKEVEAYLGATLQNEPSNVDSELVCALLSYLFEPAVQRSVGREAAWALQVIVAQGSEAADVVTSRVLVKLKEIEPLAIFPRIIINFLNAVQCWTKHEAADIVLRRRADEWVAIAEHFSQWPLVDSGYDNSATLAAAAATLGVSLAAGRDDYGALAARALNACLVHVCPPGSSSSKRPIPNIVLLSDAISQTAWSEAIVSLLTGALDAIEPAEIERFEAGGYHFGNMPSFVWASQALDALTLHGTEETKKRLIDLDWSGRRIDDLGRVLAFWLEGFSNDPMAGWGSLSGNWFEGPPEAVIRFVAGLLGRRSPPYPRRLARVAFALQLVDESDLHEDDRLSLPEELPHDVSQALAMLDSLRVSQTCLPRPDGASASVRNEAAKGLGLERLPRDLKLLYREHNGFGRLLSLDQVTRLLGEFHDAIENHREEAGDSALGRLGCDVRHHEEPGRCIPLGQTSTGDILFVDPAVIASRSEKMPVMRYHHDQALTCSVEAVSIGHFVALEIARAFLRERNASNAISAHIDFEKGVRLRLPKTAQDHE